IAKHLRKFEPALLKISYILNPQIYQPASNSKSCDLASFYLCLFCFYPRVPALDFVFLTCYNLPVITKDYIKSPCKYSFYNLNLEHLNYITKALYRKGSFFLLKKGLTMRI